MAQRTLTFEEFENQCRPSAELLEEELHDPLKREEDWDLVFDLSRRPLWKWSTEERSFYIGLILPLKGGDWLLPLVRLGNKKPTAITPSDEP